MGFVRRHCAPVVLWCDINYDNYSFDDDNDDDDDNVKSDEDTKPDDYLKTKPVAIRAASPLLNRRRMITQAVAINAMLVGGSQASPATSSAIETMNNNDAETICVPLEYIPTLQAYIVRYELFEEPFAAIIDTGGPFLTVPSYCLPYRTQKMTWGCYKPERTVDSGYRNTVEGFDNNYGTVVWRKAQFAFPKTTTTTTTSTTTTENVTMTTQQEIIFGVLDRSLLDGSGGVFFGLIKTTRASQQIRPSFLQQTPYTSFCIDLRQHNNTSSSSSSSARRPQLILSTRSMIPTTANTTTNNNNEDAEDGPASYYYIPLVQDLYRRYQAPVIHYTALASKLVVNGLPLLISQRQPLYVIFDTGVSGMIVSQELFDGRYLQARTNREKSLWGSVDVTFALQHSTSPSPTITRGRSRSRPQTEAPTRTLTLSATKPVTTPLGLATPWKGFRGNLIVLGLAFLDNRAMTIDVDEGKLLFTN